MDFSQLQAWLHVAIVHIPVIIAPVSLFLLTKGKRNESADFLRLGHTLVLLVTLTSAVAYFTGPTTVDWWQEKVQFDQEAVEAHGLWGRISFTLLTLAGVGSLMTIIGELQDEKPHPLIFSFVWWLLFTGVISLIWTAHQGGLLRRPELAF